MIKEDERAELRNVSPGMRVEGMTEITSGVQAGERVVIDGQMLLDNGIKVVERSQAKGEKQQKPGKNQP